MKERPILFKSEMIKAILDGRKTQTRRVVKSAKDRNGSGCHLAPCEIAGDVNGGDYSLSPYGQPGDHLWVRETWNLFISSQDGDECWPIKTIPKVDPRGADEEHFHAELDYAATTPLSRRAWLMAATERPWRPSIHMPRWASRITLEITAIRVERLCDISNVDAIGEGIKPVLGCWKNYGCARYNKDFKYPINSFRSLWQSINRLDSWEANPWVWVVEFKRVDQ